MKKGLNIYKRKDGRWEGRYIKGYNKNGKTKYGYIYTSSYSETKEKLMNIYNPSEATNVIALNTIVTLDSVADEWLRTAKIKIKQSTYTKYYYTIKNHIKGNKLGSYAMNRLTTPIISEYTNKLIEKGKLSAKTIKDILNVIGAIIKYYNRTYENSIDIIITFPRCERKAVEVFTATEIEAIERNCIENNTDTEKLGILLALYTGIRLGELCALKWENINLTDGYITINKTLQRVRDFERNDGAKTKVVEDTPKSKTSIRQIPLPDFILPLLRKHQAETGEIYFLTGTENYIEPRTYQNHFKKFLQEWEIEQTNFHVVRHTFATRYISKENDGKSLSELLGHSNVNITLNRYVHPSFEQKRANINKIVPSILAAAVNT